MTASAYPVHVDAHLDPQLSRWQWLLKWLLVIPHYVVLVFLWLAFVVLSMVAFFAILVTGRYPRGIFDFNVGVLRWTWRVTYYAYGALGTDRYPPFSLSEEPDYPAHLEVDYPERLSRGLVLVKWWLLALPHYLVLALLLGGAGYAASGTAEQDWVWGTGLIGLLVLVAGVVLLFTGRYPQPLFDLVLGLNRWVLRVAGYAALMTDEYPPFRLDQGAEDGPVGSGVAVSPPPVAPPTGTPAPGATTSGWTAGRVVALTLGCLLGLGSLGLGAVGGTLALADATLRDDAGFLMSGEETVTSDTFAVSSTSMEVHADAPAAFMPEEVVGDVKVRVTPPEGTEVFVGLGPTAEVARYLEGVAHATVVDLRDEPVLRTSVGSAPGAPPGDVPIWAEQSSGPGTQEVTWPLENGSWTLVVMNADGTRGVDVDVAAGAEVPALEWLVAGLLTLAGLGLLVAVVLVAVPVRGASKGR